MNVGKYKLTKDVIICDKLFISGDIIYIEHYDPVNGKPQRVFDESKELLGKITSDCYWKLNKTLTPINNNKLKKDGRTKIITSTNRNNASCYRFRK